MVTKFFIDSGYRFWDNQALIKTAQIIPVATAAFKDSAFPVRGIEIGY